MGAIKRDRSNYKLDLSRLIASRLIASNGIPLRAMLRDYVVILLPLKEMPALSQRLDRAAYESPGRGSPLFVVARSNGEQVGAVAGYENHQQLMHELARGWVAAAEANPHSARRLHEVKRLLQKARRRSS